WWGWGVDRLLVIYWSIPFIATDDPYFLWAYYTLVVTCVCLPYGILVHMASLLLTRKWRERATVSVPQRKYSDAIRALFVSGVAWCVVVVLPAFGLLLYWRWLYSLHWLDHRPEWWERFFVRPIILWVPYAVGTLSVRQLILSNRRKQ